MTDRLDEAMLRRLITAHLSVDADRLQFHPIRTGKYNRSFVVHTGYDDLVLRIAPPQNGMLFYERNMMAQEPAIHALLREKTFISNSFDETIG